MTLALVAGCGGDGGGNAANSPPIAVLDAPPFAAIGEVVRLDASRSSDPDAADAGNASGQIVSFRFVLAGGVNDRTLVSASPLVSHVFTRTGMFDVCVDVTDGMGSTSELACRRIAVTATPRDGGPDARITDAGPDGRVTDGGPDGRIVDGGPMPDARIVDGGPMPDARIVDGGPMPDARIVDSGPMPDARIVDSGPMPDARIVDAGPADTGRPDSGPRPRYIETVVPNQFRDVRNMPGTFDLGRIADDTGRVIPVPGGFPYWDGTFTQVGVTDNGYLVFGTNPELRAFNNTTLPNPAQPNNAIYVFWDDLTPKSNGGSTIHARVEFMPNPRMIIQWTNWAFFQPTPQSNMTFQVVLNQNGDIDFFYQSLSHPPNPRRATGNSATIGLENANGTQAVLHSFQMGGMADPGGVVNTMTGLHYQRLP